MMICANQECTNQTCTVDSCYRSAVSSGWCQHHFDNWVRNCDPLVEIKRCSLSGCQGEHHAKSFCVKHYARFKRHGHPGQADSLRAAKGEHVGCKVADCDGKHHSLGFCNLHCKRFKRHGDPLFKTRAAKGEHYSRWKRGDRRPGL